MDYTSLLKENWIMLTSICLSLLPLATILLLLLYPKPITSFRISSSSSSSSSRQRQQQQRVLWHEDAQYMECHGDLHQELNSNQSQQLLEDYNEKEPHVTHFCFLVHGLAGFSQDLSYLETVMRLMVKREKHSLATTTTTTKGIRRHAMVVHTPTCNENKTQDGVIKGGERLLQEMLDTIRTTMTTRKEEPRSDDDDDDNGDGSLRDVTISIVGNSLGGIYCRYAIAQLVERTDNMVLDGAYKLHFNIFCTTATPHLGISKHTYIPIPRAAEIGMAHTMGDTGKDLFRLNDLLKTMATTPQYLQPLGIFRKRIAYANAYGTDFPVPTATAAFLHADSTYPHHADQLEGGFPEEEDEDCLVVDDNGLVVATFHTPRQHHQQHTDATSDNIEHTDDLAFMSHCLDSLGWKKVFIDLRQEMPIAVNLRRLRRITDSSPSLESLKRKRVVGSREVHLATGMPPDRISWPVGHNMIVAFSRNHKTASFNKGGRPVVDALANELVEFIFAWESPEE